MIYLIKKIKEIVRQKSFYSKNLKLKNYLTNDIQILKYIMIYLIEKTIKKLWDKSHFIPKNLKL